MEVQFVTKGGIRMGRGFWLSRNYSFPFAEMRATADVVEIKFPKGNVRIERPMVKKLFVQAGLFSSGIRIVHGRDDLEPFILFWTFKAKTAAHFLSEMGYPVDFTNQQQQQSGVSR